MSTAAAQLLFAAEFVTMLVAAAGVALVALRPDITRSTGGRAAVVLGFVATGAAAFVHGARLFQSNPSVALSVARIGGGLLLLAGANWWSGGRQSKSLLNFGVTIGLAAAIVESADGPATLIDILLILGSVIVGVSLVQASRRAIAARVAASAAGTLLLVVLVLSVALSAVISSSVQRDELVRLASQA
nr:hypothetical protein [Actinomycetota bacterium]